MKQQRKRELLIIGGVLILIFYVLPRIYAPTECILDPYDYNIEYREKRWFQSDKVVMLQWREDSEGNEGWCTKNENGQWYIFVVEDFSKDY